MGNRGESFTVGLVTALLAAWAAGCVPVPESQQPAVAAQDEPASQPTVEAPAVEPDPNKVALVGGRILDGYGGAPIENGTLVIEGERITAIGPAAQVTIPADARRVPAEGMTLLPGLFDMHVHLMLLGHGDYERWGQVTSGQMVDVVMPAAARQLLYAGVTSARDLGADPDEILEVRRRIRAGEIPGPRLFVAGPFLQRAPYADWEARYRWGIDTTAKARQVVKSLARRGVDCIKLIDQDQMNEDVVEAIVQAAHEEGLPVVAHAHRSEEIRIGLRYGVDDFEHTGLGTSPGYPEDILESLRERNAALYWTPTLSPLYTMQYTGEVFPERLDDPAWRQGMPDALADEIRRSLEDVTHLPYYALFPSRIPRLPHKFQQLRETGVHLLIGTDSGIPTMFHSDSTWRELALWVELGMSPMEVIQAATLWPARFLHVEQDLGTLAVGRLADVIGVRGDPLTDMKVLGRVALVFQGGRQIR